MDTFGSLVVERKSGAELVPVDLLERWDGGREHLLIVVVHRHRVVCQVDSGQLQALEVLLVLICVLQIVPVDPKILKVGKMV